MTATELNSARLNLFKMRSTALESTGKPHAATTADDDDDDDYTSSSGPSSSESESEEDVSEDEDEKMQDGETTRTTSTAAPAASSSSSIPSIPGRPKPTIHRMEGGSDLLSRLSTFLPQMEHANRDLEREIAAGRGKDMILDEVDDEDEKEYIEMVRCHSFPSQVWCDMYTVWY